MIEMDADRGSDYTGVVQWIRNENTPESLAFLMFTAGSKGRPSGVTVPHRTVMRLVVVSKYVALNRDSTVLQFAPIRSMRPLSRSGACRWTVVNVFFYQPLGIVPTRLLVGMVFRLSLRYAICHDITVRSSRHQM